MLKNLKANVNMVNKKMDTFKYKQQKTIQMESLELTSIINEIKYSLDDLKIRSEVTEKVWET